MAPVGRWQQGRDLSWYTKGEDPDAAKKAREEEIRKIKEAEQEAIARALGLPVSVPSASSNANMEPLGGKEAEQTILEGAAGDKGVGFGSFSGNMPAGDNIKKLDPMGDVSGNYDQVKRANADGRTLGDRHLDWRKEHSRRDDRERTRDHRSRRDDHRSDRRDRRRYRSRSRDREAARRRRSASRSRSRGRGSGEHRSRHRRSRSPHASRHSRDDRGHDRYDRRR